MTKTILESPVTSSVDTNKYRMLKLPNGVRILLISVGDSETSFPDWHHRSANMFGVAGNFEKGSKGLKVIDSHRPKDLSIGTFPVPSTLASHNLDSYCLEVDDFPTSISFETMAERPNDKTFAKSKGKRFYKIPLSYVSLTVNVGGSDDPEAHCGLAHFLEHMVHYGSEEYPEEDAYFRWMMEHSRQMNAFTQSDTTSYYFGCPSSALEKSLDMLTSMIANPLLQESVAIREIESVDNEFLLKADHYPSWKHIQVLCSSAKKNHPLNSFMCGNLRSLNGGKQDAKKLTESLKKFHKENYVGSGMTAAIQSNLSVDELEALVSKKFMKVRKGNGSIRRETVVEKYLQDPFNTDAFRKVNFIHTDHAPNFMWIVWPLPAHKWQDYTNKPLDFLGFLLCQEWEGGLIHKLRKSGLVIEVNAECPRGENGRNQYCSLFQLELILAEAGKELQNLKRIISIAFEGLEAIRKMPEDQKIGLWSDFFQVQKNAFDGSGPGYGPDFVASCSRLLQTLEGKEIFRREGYPSKNFNDKVFGETLEFLRPDTMNVSLCSSSYPPSLRKIFKKRIVEKYTGVEYNQATLSDFNEKTEDFLRQLNKSTPLEIKLPSPPGKNPFQIERLPLSGRTVAAYKVDNSENSKIELYHGGNQPSIRKSLCCIQFVNPDNRFNERGQSLLTLMTQCLIDSVCPLQSELQRGGIECRIFSDLLGLRVQFLGFPGTFVTAIQSMLKSLFNATLQLEETAYDLAKEGFIAQTKYILSIPDKIAHNLLVEILNKDQPPMENILKILEKIEFRNVQNYCEFFKKSSFASVWVAGNITAQETQQIAEAVEDLDFYPRLGGLHKLSMPVETLYLPHGERCIRARSHLRTCRNTSVFNAYEFQPQRFPFDLSEVVDFSELLMKGACFWYLRTWKQLGYAVASHFIRGKAPMILVSLTGPATKHSACLMDESIDSFMNIFYDLCLEDLTETDVNEMKLLWGFAGTFTAEDVKSWYKTQVLPNVVRNENLVCSWDKETAMQLGVRKLSIQILGRDEENCKGHEKCGKPHGLTRPFQTGAKGKNLSFAVDKDNSEPYFISNIKHFKRET